MGDMPKPQAQACFETRVRTCLRFTRGWVCIAPVGAWGCSCLEPSIPQPLLRKGWGTRAIQPSVSFFAKKKTFPFDKDPIVLYIIDYSKKEEFVL